ncbi:hypothetical protein HUE56_00700 (plasmid) [Azospirillum oryzae]|uniref:Hpr(Ser) kinase/phosphatase n=2 Tax=Azospirillum oryzae TaxID=286727 RepID=A0A6N1ABZ3_9PROT|nr:hypothetical protein [Azospirillum oryzae]KAA0586618.1 hypothetical protein FZ938_20690 [Azospirillum oryzae]QKS49063.1 hypothetical protein HUE56_00700 [Azospirillum oryzae]
MAVSYELCGLRLSSDLALPELPAILLEGRPPDLRVRLGAAPRPSAAAAHDPHGLILPDGGFWAEEPGVARFRVEAGRQVTVDPLLPADDPEVRCHLYGTMLGVLCHQRGLLPLHGTAVVRDGRALLLTGGRNTGKSILAYALAGRGAALLADDVAVPAADGLRAGAAPRLLPGLPTLRLSAETIASLGIPMARALPVADGKHALPGLVPVWREPAPLAAVVELAPGMPGMEAGAGVRLDRLDRVQAAVLLSRNTFRGRIGNHLGRGRALLAAAAALAAAVPCWRLRCPADALMPGAGPGVEPVPELVADMVERAWREDTR